MTNTLHVTMDNEVVDAKIEDIFSTEKFDSLIGVTYSITPRFMNRYLEDFNHIELVVGIPEERIRKGANQAAKAIKAKVQGDLNNEPAQLYQELTTNIKNKLNNKHVELFVPTAYVIHSKFYLLSHQETGENRIVIGSANLSEQAFMSTTNQFENVIVFDNHPLFNIYLEHYEMNLKPLLMYYFPKELLDINAKKLKKHSRREDLEVEELILLNNEEIKKIKEDAVLETIQEVDRKVQLGVLPVNVREEMRNIMDDRLQEVRIERENKKQENVAFQLVKESIAPRAKEPKMRAVKAFKKEITKQLKTKIYEDFDTHTPERELVVNLPEQRNLTKGYSGIFTKNEIDKNKMLSYGAYASLEEIKDGLDSINLLLKTFEDYTVKYDDAYGARVLEAIFYTFTSPFLFEIKGKARSEEERNDIPQFLFLGGTPGSGKSSLLKVIAKLTDQPFALNYDLIRPHGEHGRKKKIVDTIGLWMRETNVAPILIDEIPQEFFTMMNYGNELIVNTANQLAYNLQAAPALIGTTNADGYTLEERARRRSYYLRLDKIFDELLRETSQPAYNKVYNRLNPKLFGDFIMRFADRLSDDNLNWANFGEAGKIDFLYHTRQIFKEYYQETNTPLPRYFPMTRYDDSKETNQEKWRKLYLGTSQQDFKFDELSGNLLFKLAILDENIRMYGSGRPSEIYKNALSQKVVVGSKDGTDIELDTPLFFEWIDVQNPYVQYYQDKLRHALENKKFIFKEDKQRQTLSFDVRELFEQENKAICSRFLEYLPKEAIIEQKENKIITHTEAIIKWAGLEDRKTLWQKIISY